MRKFCRSEKRRFIFLEMRKEVQSGNGCGSSRNLLVLLQIFHVYYVASIATRAANPVTKNVSPVSLLISEYAPDLEALRGERMTEASV